MNRSTNAAQMMNRGTSGARINRGSSLIPFLRRATASQVSRSALAARVTRNTMGAKVNRSRKGVRVNRNTGQPSVAETGDRLRHALAIPIVSLGKWRCRSPCSKLVNVDNDRIGRLLSLVLRPPVGRPCSLAPQRSTGDRLMSQRGQRNVRCLVLLSLWLSGPPLAGGQTPAADDWTETGGTWQTQSYWQDAKILQRYTFSK